MVTHYPIYIKEKVQKINLIVYNLEDKAVLVGPRALIAMVNGHIFAQLHMWKSPEKAPSFTTKYRLQNLSLFRETFANKGWNLSISRKVFFARDRAGLPWTDTTTSHVIEDMGVTTPPRTQVQ